MNSNACLCTYVYSVYMYQDPNILFHTAALEKKCYGYVQVSKTYFYMSVWVTFVKHL